MIPPSPCSLAQWMSCTAWSTSSNEMRPDRRAARAPARRSRPASGCTPAGLALELGTGERPDVVGRPRLEGHPFGNSTSATTPWVSMSFRRRSESHCDASVESGLDAARLPRSPSLLVLEPFVEDIEILLFDVLPIRRYVVAVTWPSTEMIAVRAMVLPPFCSCDSENDPAHATHL